MKPQRAKPNDDEDISPEELDVAADETPADVIAPELTGETKELVEWDEAPEASGHVAPKILPDDEATVAEQLVDEGTDEAERDRRIAAADPDMEP